VNVTAPIVLLSGAEPAPAGTSSSQMLTEKAVAARLDVTVRTLQRLAYHR
jgi:hypothetical protein